MEAFGGEGSKATNHGDSAGIDGTTRVFSGRLAGSLKTSGPAAGAFFGGANDCVLDASEWIGSWTQAAASQRSPL
jgi:hypothetical protein